FDTWRAAFRHLTTDAGRDRDGDGTPEMPSLADADLVILSAASDASMWVTFAADRLAAELRAIAGPEVEVRFMIDGLFPPMLDNEARYHADAPEDFDGLEDDDGCPEVDADGDGIADVDDRCKTRPETRNGVADDDGCPDSDLVTFTDGGFETLKPIHFEFDSAIIKPESYPVVRAVAEALRAHGHIRRMEIGGHTDSRGSAAYNLALSRRRAAAVRQFLVDEGIAADRLESEGYGETRPLDDRKTDAAHARNRRVEFLILDDR
ncbi:MAG: OmpA family protein, partial [Kofleriaceae bacterium]